ncbi:MAG: ion transporter [Chloroflexota bacterium]
MSDEQRHASEAERAELRERLADWLDAPLTALGSLMLALLIVEWTVDLTPSWSARVSVIQNVIWAIFIVDFVVELTLAPAKLQYLRTNWLTAIGVVLPALRAIRVLRVARVFRGLSLVRLTTTLNRASRVAGALGRRGELGYVLLLTLIVTTAAAAGVYFFEREAFDSTIRTPWDAAWWAATIVTTINSPLETVTLEGRIVALGLRIFALAFSGYLTAVIAVHLLGSGESPNDAVLQRLAQLEANIFNAQLETTRSVETRAHPPARDTQQSQ